MKIILFTAEEATQLARELTPRLTQLRALRVELKSVFTHLDALSLALAGASMSNPDREEQTALNARRKALQTRLRAGFEAVLKSGVIVKDLDAGLFDFYALSGDRLVFLCWKLGEPEVMHWHPLQGGFATRRSLALSPLDHSPLEE